MTWCWGINSHVLHNNNFSITLRTHRIALIIFEKACSNLRNLLSVHAGWAFTWLDRLLTKDTIIFLVAFTGEPVDLVDAHPIITTGLTSTLIHIVLTQVTMETCNTLLEVIVKTLKQGQVLAGALKLKPVWNQLLINFFKAYYILIEGDLITCMTKYIAADILCSHYTILQIYSVRVCS